MKKISARMWATLILIGLVGQFAWTIENMYFNVFLYNTISTDPRYISAMVGWSAAAATLTTLLLGYKTAAKLERLGRLQADEETVQLIDDLLYGEIPYISDYI